MITRRCSLSRVHSIEPRCESLKTWLCSRKSRGRRLRCSWVSGIGLLDEEVADLLKDEAKLTLSIRCVDPTN